MSKPIKEGYELVGYAVRSGSALGDRDGKYRRPSKLDGQWHPGSTSGSRERVILPEAVARECAAVFSDRKLVRVIRRKPAPKFEGWVVRHKAEEDRYLDAAEERFSHWRPAAHAHVFTLRSAAEEVAARNSFYREVVAWPLGSTPPTEAPHGYHVVHERDPRFVLRAFGRLSCAVHYGPPVVFPTRKLAEWACHGHPWRKVVEAPAPSTAPEDVPAPAGKSYVVRKTDVQRFRTQREARQHLHDLSSRGCQCEVRLEDDPKEAA